MIWHLKWYHIFHIVVEEGSHCRYSSQKNEVISSWKSLIGSQRVIMLSDYTKLSEVIVSAIQVVEGSDFTTVTKSWKGSTSTVVAKAIENISSTSLSTKKTGVIRFK